MKNYYKLTLPAILLLLVSASGLNAHPLDSAQFSTSDVLLTYFELGFTHIIPFGLDHILFILGLYFLNSNLKTTLIQATAFTVAHSITLALAIFKIIDIPSSFIEPIIALSIVFIAVENIVTKKLYSWRILVVFLFGLIHGLGFASVLFELGLPESQYITALLSFNAGVEVGQIAVILAAYILIGKWFKEKVWYRPRIVIPISFFIAIIALYWTIERV